jgi:UDP-N-acetylmuramoyl-L-alanyl-D-glutamate--2,6-diaminopimelate ligase
MIKKLVKKFTPEFLLSWYHLGLAFLGAVLCGFPSRKLKVIGVTGTNGKTTVVNMAAKVLAAGGLKVAALSSVNFIINGEEKPNLLRMTMPGRFKIQQFLKEAVKQGCQYALLEVSSEGIKQSRHRFIKFDTAVFTNLSPEHIEAHKGFENYQKAKGSFFKIVKNNHIINAEDKYADYFLKFPAKKIYTYGLNGGDVNNVLKLNLQVPGEFNVYNALAAIAIGLLCGVDLQIGKRAVESFIGVPGRMELVIKEPFKVFIDYAFTPNALEKVYQTLKPRAVKLVCVLGACGGGRDKWKRPVLGEIASRYCDKIIVTNEDSYDEDPMKIIKEVAAKAERAELVLDRRAAISKALLAAEPGDIVVITGKGCEPWIFEANGKKVPWDDRKVAVEEFEKLKLA